MFEDDPETAWATGGTRFAGTVWILSDAATRRSTLWSEAVPDGGGDASCRADTRPAGHVGLQRDGAESDCDQDGSEADACPSDTEEGPWRVGRGSPLTT